MLKTGLEVQRLTFSSVNNTVLRLRTFVAVGYSLYIISGDKRRHSMKTRTASPSFYSRKLDALPTRPLPRHFIPYLPVIPHLNSPHNGILSEYTYICLRNDTITKNTLPMSYDSRQRFTYIWLRQHVNVMKKQNSEPEIMSKQYIWLRNRQMTLWKRDIRTRPNLQTHTQA